MMFPVSGAMIRWYLMVFNVIQWDEKSLAMSGVKYPLVNKHNYWKGPFTVDLPIKNGDFPYLCKRLPEGKQPEWLE